LARGPQDALAFLNNNLRPAAAPDPGRLAGLLADLGSDSFEAREKAAEALRQLGESAGPALRKALGGPASPETRRRARQLLDELAGPVTSPGAVRAIRAAEVLEHIGTAEARRLLRALAGGDPAARLTREAKASLERLDRRSAP
jgi:hypothetical protein